MIPPLNSNKVSITCYFVLIDLLEYILYRYIYIYKYIDIIKSIYSKER